MVHISNELDMVVCAMRSQFLPAIPVLSMARLCGTVFYISLASGGRGPQSCHSNTVLFHQSLLASIDMLGVSCPGLSFQARSPEPFTQSRAKDAKPPKSWTKKHKASVRKG